MDQPSFKTIADLFQVPQPEAGDVASAPRRKEGRNAEESDELGRQSLTDGDIETAIKHFRKAVEQRDPDDPASRIELAGAYNAGDFFPQAMRQYQEALRVREQAEPHVGLSDLFKRYGRFRDSITHLEQAIRLEPNSSYHHLKLAEALREMGERKKALVAIQHAVAAKPDDPFLHYWMGDLLMQMKRYDDALDALRAAIELSPGDDFLYLRATVAFWNAGRRPEAVKALRLASDLDPDKHVYHGLLGHLLAEMGQQEEADQESGRAAKMDRYDEDTIDRLLDEMGFLGE